MNPSLFSVFSLFLVALYSVLHAEIISEFRSGDKERTVIEQIKEELAGERLKYKVLAGEYFSFKHDVASVLPDYVQELGADPEKGYPVRNLASLVLTSQALHVLVDSRDQIISAAKEHFRSQNYDKAIALLEDFVVQHETSSKVIEAQFLLAECHFQKKSFERSLVMINRMLTLYPDNELTGFLLLRLGAILEDQHKDLDARNVYETITRNFENKDLVYQAERNLQRLSL